MQISNSKQDIAIIGMACRFPDANTIYEYWKNITEGKCSIRLFSKSELDQHAIDQHLVNDPDYVNAAVVLNDFDKFDADFFKIPPRIACLLDPQQRLLLEVGWEAFEDAGYPPEQFPGVIGAFTGSGGVVSSYLLDCILKNPKLLDNTGSLLHLGNDKDFVSARLSYAFNLTGPSINVQTACSTSITAIHLASQSISSGECDIALVGTSNVRIPHHRGYLAIQDSVYSPDGYCYPFDEKAKGTIFGSGVAVLILKDMQQAILDNDNIYAIIKSTAVNNDGSKKLSFTTTSTMGQTRAITEAMLLSGVDPADISYVECHGTGTYLGDPLEIQALKQAFDLTKKPKRFDCALSSVKGNIGHLDHSAGLASIIKVALALKHRKLPATINFHKLNPKIDLTNTPFYVNTSLKDWNIENHPRFAGVNSLGLGGSNAFAILTETSPCNSKNLPEMTGPLLFTVSAKSIPSLEKLIDKYKLFLSQKNTLSLADVCFTAAVGRAHFKYRLAIIASSITALLDQLMIGDMDKITLPSEPIMGNSSLETIRQHYLSGEDINWKSLYDGFNVKRISLPTYAFDRQRFWLE